MPSRNKIWPGIRITAKGSGLIVSYRTGNFETTGTGWTAFAELALTSEFVDYALYINATSKKIQFKFSNVDGDGDTDGDDFQIANYAPMQPAIMGEV